MFITKKHIPRRTFLRGVGATVALPFLESMLPAVGSVARAAQITPTRFTGIFIPHGAAPGYWVPSGERNFVLSYKDQFTRTVAEKLLTYALGRGVEYYDMPVVRSIVRDADKGGDRFDTLIVDVVKSAPFQMNSKPGQPVTRQAQPAAATTASARD